MRFNLDSMEGSASSNSAVEYNGVTSDPGDDRSQSPEEAWVPPVPIPPEVLHMPFDVVLETFPWLPRVLQDHLYEYNPEYLYREHPEMYPGIGEDVLPHLYAPTFDLGDNRGPGDTYDAHVEAQQRNDRYRAIASRNGVPPVLMDFNDVDFNQGASGPIDKSVSPKTNGNGGNNQPADGRGGHHQPQAGRGRSNQPNDADRDGHDQPVDGESESFIITTLLLRYHERMIHERWARLIDGRR
ncbi:hypothetical protein F4820DRAFT_454470 [Hypoxylon rubiginosum]|uniref:Uncharacterized protein n=1 Tax=Hypoxylon rubiginosum TaxID=110542 RepID=A0ACB9YI56_9PEZI|nr:hypothetical protein F4820DRAFT_454470 [Hypoxylon rubiginosum]